MYDYCTSPVYVSSSLVSLYTSTYTVGKSASNLTLKRFFHESFQVNAVYLEQCIDKLSEEKLMDIKVQITSTITTRKSVHLWRIADQNLPMSNKTRAVVGCYRSCQFLNHQSLLK